jgi:hypothetical protein
VADRAIWRIEQDHGCNVIHFPVNGLVSMGVHRNTVDLRRIEAK